MLPNPVRASVLSTSRGRALLVAKDGALYISRGYAIYRSDEGSIWTPPNLVLPN